jgi:hypothetical protein
MLVLLIAYEVVMVSGGTTIKPHFVKIGPIRWKLLMHDDPTGLFYK